jgi:hypothetical protein
MVFCQNTDPHAILKFLIKHTWPNTSTDDTIFPRTACELGLRDYNIDSPLPWLQYEAYETRGDVECSRRIRDVELTLDAVVRGYAAVLATADVKFTNPLYHEPVDLQSDESCVLLMSSELAHMVNSNLVKRMRMWLTEPDHESAYQERQILRSLSADHDMTMIYTMILADSLSICNHTDVQMRVMNLLGSRHRDFQRPRMMSPL